MKENAMKKLICFFLAMTMLMTSLNLAACKKSENTPDPAPGVEVVADTTIYDMKTDDFTEPIGIDSTSPLFSWKMQSDITGQKQTAYQISVTDEAGNTVWNSGKVESSNSVDIAYEGETLTSSTSYQWTVTVWDKDGQEISSPTATFETALLEEDAFSDTNFISYSKSAYLDNTTYTIDFDFILDSGSLGFCFGVEDSNNMMMWQINTVAVSGKVVLRPHVKSGGNWTLLAGNIDLTDTLGMTSSEFLGKEMHAKIAVNGRTVKTYLGTDQNNLTLVNTYTYSQKIVLNKIGIRMHSNENEVARFDNIVVTDESGNILYQNDFSSSSTGFTGSGASELVDGMLKAGTTDGDSEQLLIQSTDSDSLPGYRKSFTVTKEVKSAKLYTCGLGVYESYINGNRVGRLLEDGTVSYQELKPGFTEASKRQYYSSFDVTWMLNANSENVLSAVVTSGWWSGQVAGSYGKETAYFAKMIITYTDGTQDILTTGTDWKAAKVSSLLMADIFNGETYDARIDTSWMLPGYDDSSWSQVVINTEFTGEIQAWKGSYITVRDDLERQVQSVSIYDGAENAKKNEYGVIHVIRTADSGSFVLNPGETALIDFGQNAAGWECFTVEGSAGTTITVLHAEMLNDSNGETSRGNDGPGGSIYTANLRTAAATTTYILSGNGLETYHPSFTFYGFRYIEITATETVTFHALSAQVVTSVEQDIGYIETDNENINQLFSNIRWGQYSNYLSVPTDCPQRDERQGWTADTQVFAEAGSYLGFSKSFLEKFMQDMRDSQASDGSFPGTSPTGEYSGGGWGGTGWADAGVIIPYTLYVMYGDLEAIEENWSSMQKYVDKYLGRTRKKGPANIWGDWLAYESNDDDLQSLLAIAYYAWDALMMSEMATALGYDDEATKYQKLYETEKEYFIEQYVNSNGKLKRSEQTACLYALYLNLLPDEDSYAKVAKQLVTNIKRNGNKLQTGFLGTKILLDTLTKIGETELAYTLLLQEDNPSWLYSVLQGATTVWERWNSYTIESGFGDVSMNSFNHYAYGSVAAWMFHTMVGINYDTENPGFKNILVSPYPDARIGSVSASYESAYGTITVKSAYTETEWDYTISIPANTTADIKIPTMNFSTITVNGKSLSDLSLETDGIEYISTEDGVYIFRAVNGFFAFLSN
jgi:hypothetical protein